ncbi:MAG: phenylalanine--tRNA ligase subunit beta [Candidatus Nanopelagicaceae bacterium]|nr:phenylalanine--tRNA ligase subunit beta [Candidatus Nanopelagicaceae bacterium]
MKLPLSWLSEFIAFPKKITIDQIVEGFVKVGFEVEGVENPAKDIQGPLVIGQVISIEELTEFKKPIRYVALNCGEKSLRYVVCGATNFKENDFVIVAMPGAVLPGGFAIAVRETYGKTSNGMICSARELGLGDDHSGIMVLEAKKAKPGVDAKVFLGINDPVIDIAVNPDRGYAMSIRGAARELAMSLDLEFKDVNSKALISSLEKKKKSGKKVSALITDPSGASRIYLQSLIDVDPLKPTPDWMARRLTQCGMRSISLAVDITNYVMLELGQPLHAFDTAKIQGSLRVQRAGKYKDFVTLDNVKRKLSTEDLVIADDKKVLALAGTMGGLESEVSEFTASIALEAAHFTPMAVAQNSRRHVLSSEASRRFERGVDPELAEIASARAALLLIELSGAKYVGSSKKITPIKLRTATFSSSEISELIGCAYSDKEVQLALTKIGCKLRKSGKKWIVSIPSWRPDLNNMPDFAEEVARYFGYQRIPSILPNVKPAKSGASGLTSIQQRKRGMALQLAARGLVEVHNYPFVSAKQMELFNFTGDRAKTFKIANPMSEEMPFLRTHLTPGLLATAARNLARGEKSVALFETGLVFRNTEKLIPAGNVPTSKRPTAAQIKKIYESVPKQALHVAGVLAGDFEQAGWWGSGRSAEWTDALDLVAELIASTGNQFTVHNVELAPWHPGRCAEFQVNGKAVAHAGEIHPRIISELALPPRTVAFALIMDALPFAESVKAAPVVTMPAAIQDISLFVPQEVSAQQVKEALIQGAGELLESIQLFDRYQKPGEQQVSLAFTLVFRASDRTLTSDEVSALRTAAGEQAVKSCKAVLRS